jgi:hypothetical protein
MKNLNTKIIIICIISFILFIQLRAYHFEKELSKNGVFSVGRIDSIVVMPKLTNIYISYYSEKIKLITPERKKENNVDQDDVGKFYEIKYLKASPSIVRTNFLKQITDSTEIMKAGFSIEDIKK